MDWSCDFYVNYWPDVIEEEALNEKSCLQVLRILIAKSDNEIEGLEGELLFLETHLERADKNKAEEWFDICCKELNEKIQSLELSICSLKDERIQNENDHGVQSQTSREPAKKVHDIIKEASLRNIYVKHEPPANTSYEDLLDTFSSQFRNSDSANIKVEEVIESNFTAKDQITKERMRLNQHEAMKVQEAGAIVSVNTRFSDSSLIVQGQGVTNIVQLAQVESQEPTPAPATDKGFRLIPSLKSQEQGRKNIILSEISKGQGKKARSYRKTAPKSTPKTVTRTPKTPKAPKIPESRTQSDWFVQKTGMSSVKPGGAKKRKQEQLDDENFSSQTNGNKVSRTVTDDVIESGDAFTQSRANLNSIFKSEDKTNNHGTMQLDAVEVKDPCVSPFRIPKFENLRRLTVAQMKDIAKSCGLKGLAHKKKDQIIRSLEEYTGRQL